MSRTDQLAHKSSRGVFVTFGGFASKTLLQIGSTAVLARQLDPADFGLIAMVVAVVGVVDLVRDFGLTGAILQARDLSERMWQSLMWLSLLIGFGLMAIVAALAPALALLYDEDRLVVLTLAIAPTLLINGLLMPMQARIQRDLRFGTMASIDVMSMLAGVVLAIIGAALGFGVWSLVILTGAGQLYRLAALWVAARPSFGRPHISKDVLSLVRTGGSIFGVQLLNYAARNADNVVIGHQLGPAALGQYSRAYALFLMPMQQLNGTVGRVALPVLSKLQDDADRYVRYIRGAAMVIGYVTIPVYAIAAAVAHPLVRLLLGDGWSEAATLFALLAIAGAGQSVGTVLGWLYLTLGRAHRQLLFFVITKPIIVAGFIVGAWWNGARGLALVYGLLTVALFLPELQYAVRGTFVRVRDIIQPIARPAAITPLCFGAAAATVSLLGSQPPLLQLLAGGLAGVLPLALSMALPDYRRDLGEIVGFVRKARAGKKPAGSSSDGGATAEKEAVG